ncbi:Outer membrane protein TolC [Marivirga sericea]|uniref:Outer membrane protein TolC n=1 Tax=Marivirga sericea TaxID=1028 RepID=A0A1X7LF58_9BACT|nr:TolC family protein [Marivirga sericea]SMG52310.1 Outer membrane protein TolC [Marivirga sericea]
MIRRLKHIAYFVIFCLPVQVHAQEILNTDKLSEQNFLSLVMENHPLIQQAQNLREMGDFAVMAAKGNFDPQLFSKNKQKYYDQKNYYQYSESGISLPTRTGITIQGGYDWTEGQFLSRESTLPNAGLWYAGVSVPVLQGLFIDDRRAALQKAFVDRRAFENEAQLMLIDILLEGSHYYWQFAKFQYQKVVIEEAIELAEDNFQNYKTSYEQGDKPAVDTLEASIQLQNLSIQNQQLEVDLANAKLNLFTFLWGQEQPLQESELQATAINNISQNKIDSLRASLPIFIQEHPAIRDKELKIQSLQIDNRLKREKLKPKLDLEYNLLQDPAGNINEIRGLDNYNWGLSFSMPLLLRQPRGELRMNEIKLENTNFELQQKRLTIRNKARQYENTFENISAQLETYRNIVLQYESLLQAELRKFEIGESSIFLINYRQMSLVNARMKYIDLQAKYRLYYRQWLHSLGAKPELWVNP